MIEVIKGLIKGNRICVLSTVSGDRPYCSLMRYACDDLCREIYLVTHRKTTKYRNLMANPHVSLLVDTREERAIDRIQALTIEGCFAPSMDMKRKNDIRGRFNARHPDLKEFMEHPDAELLCIKVQSFLLLNGLQKAYHIRISA